MYSAVTVKPGPSIQAEPVLSSAEATTSLVTKHLKIYVEGEGRAYKITRTTTARQLAMAINERESDSSYADQVLLKYNGKCTWYGNFQDREAGVHRPLVEVRNCKIYNPCVWC